ncbi:MAG: bifunctional 5,10-methylenetetrahydrofolate dehydrogenase/5,10-methenyltetrahydrofolate cyclohydrolase, partial [Flavobacteriaceae bacterium]|nr:bifunctional 5,10-methylenetetrahydrofolate dehydrogenase/5,10-methenyltetrahydrofolate cyclohydrolase [Flavobacteriaceae bacterium]
MQIIDGNAIASRILEEVKQDVAKIKGRKPSVVFIRLGNDPASISYVRKKQTTAKVVGIESRLLELSENITQQELFSIIDELNADETLDGILIQSPLPPHINPTATFAKVSPIKDVDGFHPINIGKICQEDCS